ncbi:MAG: ABC transporter permease [Candidatus Nealsonbacteria bacterium]|nr:ABC transporter permease [Candidatus Nealsonbacteria bacterium]
MKTETATKNSDSASLMQSQGPLVAFLVLCAVGTVFFPTFLTPLNLTNILRQVSLTGIVSIGMAFVILSGGIDLSVGSIAAVAAVLAAKLSGDFPVTAVLIPILAGIGLGAVNGLLITRVKLPPFIATLAMMLGAGGLAFVLSGGGSAASDTSGWFSQNIAKGDVLGIPCIGFVFILALGVAIVVAKQTSFGRSVYAIGGNEEAARMMGLHVNRGKMLVYMISGGCAATAGVLYASRYSSVPPGDFAGWELKAIAAVVISGTSLTGGIGKMGHVLYGVLILGTIPNIINKQGTLGSMDTNVITGILLLAVILLQSRTANQEEHSVGGGA